MDVIFSTLTHIQGLVMLQVLLPLLLGAAALLRADEAPQAAHEEQQGCGRAGHWRAVQQSLRISSSLQRLRLLRAQWQQSPPILNNILQLWKLLLLT